MRSFGRGTLLTTGITIILAVGFAARGQQQQGPVIIPRPTHIPSINEGLSGRTSAGYRTVYPQLGMIPASYDWFGGVLKAIGSFVQPFAANPKYLGYRFGQLVGYDFLPPVTSWLNVSRLYPGYKGIGGKNVTDVPMLGQACGDNPGDPWWVGYPRPGNVEFPPPFQLPFFTNEFDCYCRCNEKIECPLQGPFWHPNWGGPEINRNLYVPCQVCFGTERIVKHDKYVGYDHGTFPGYPRSDPFDSGYQECLRQSVESYAGSGPGGNPRDPNIYGL